MGGAAKRDIGGARARSCDAILVSGNLGDHGVAIMSQRENLGLDPLHVANEGKLVCVCAAADADRLLATLRADALGRNAAKIGTVIADDHHFVQLTTSLGGRRIVDWLAGDQLPPHLLRRARNYSWITVLRFLP